MKLLLTAIVNLLIISSFGQIRATTEDGKEVILNKNGTWKYVKVKKDTTNNIKISFKKEEGDEPIASKSSMPVKPSKSSKNVSDFEKTISGDDRYLFSGNVMITNGHDEKVKVSFKASVLKTKWEEYITAKNYTDIDAFDLVASMLALKAQYNLKNTESFVPLPTQFFMWSSDDNTFISNFKMMGRNGYGNLIETTELVSYDPNK